MVSHALLLTAGLGTRLRPLSLVRAKPAIPVGGIPMVERIVRWLATAGIDDIVLNLHALPDTITSVTVAAGSDAENALRSAVLEFMDTVRQAEHGNEEVGAAIDHLALIAEIGHRIDHGEELDEVDLVERARRRFRRGEEIEPHEARMLIGLIERYIAADFSGGEGAIRPARPLT